MGVGNGQIESWEGAGLTVGSQSPMLFIYLGCDTTKIKDHCPNVFVLG